MNALRLNVTPNLNSYKYGELHVIAAIERAATGDYHPKFGKVYSCGEEDFPIDFKISRATRRSIRSEVCGAEATVEYVVVLVYVEVPDS